MNPDQFRLVNRATAPWLTLWLLADFESARSYAVGTMAGGTYDFGDARGQYATGSKGMTAWRRDHDCPEVAVTWAEVKRWTDGFPAAIREAAAALKAAGTRLQAAYPSPYPGIGRPYSWDQPDGGTPEHRAKDRADLAAANEKREREVTEWYIAKAEHDEKVRAFLDSIAPESEPDLLDLLGAS